MRSLIALICFTLLAASGARASALPLFSADDTLELTLEFPVKTLLRGKKDKPVLDGLLHFTNERGEDVTIEMSMTTRGKSRLDYCSFPPLTLNLKRKQATGSVFEGQNKLKIVTHCRSGKLHARYLLQEYGIYRGFNILSDYSYRVRMLRITYRDTDRDGREEQHDAFFIESHDEVALRHGMERSREPELQPQQLDAQQAAIYTLYQYMIANTDWSMIKGPGEDGCCHNGKVIIKPGSNNEWVVLPYDFDQAGLINTRYSAPADQLGIKSVTTRLYRGRCLHNDLLPETVALFNEKRAEMEAVMVPEGLSERDRKKALKYIDDFYKIINDPTKLQREIYDDCLPKRRR